jgi:AmiR/NasT family two-component response regulator
MTAERAETDLPALKIVVVEDDPVARVFLKDALENQFGHEVLAEATSGTDMVRAVLRYEPDVVVFDIHLPYLNGLDALHQIYEQRITAAVAITADQHTDLIRRASEEHVLAFLIKPVNASQLGAAVLIAWTRFQELASLTAANATLQQTLQNRKTIERAKGVLMKRHRWSEPEAFRRMQRAAMSKRIAMVEVAQAVLNGVEVEL